VRARAIEERDHEVVTEIAAGPERHGVHAIGSAETPADVPEVRPDGVLAHGEDGGDLAVRQAARYERYHLLLAGSE
jgi:hypothetical protein